MLYFHSKLRVDNLKPRPAANCVREMLWVAFVSFSKFRWGVSHSNIADLSLSECGSRLFHLPLEEAYSEV